jgi:hypothetical protein
MTQDEERRSAGEAAAARDGAVQVVWNAGGILRARVERAERGRHWWTSGSRRCCPHGHLAIVDSDVAVQGAGAMGQGVYWARVVRGVDVVVGEWWW